MGNQSQNCKRTNGEERQTQKVGVVSPGVRKKVCRGKRDVMQVSHSAGGMCRDHRPTGSWEEGGKEGPERRTHRARQVLDALAATGDMNTGNSAFAPDSRGM